MPVANFEVSEEEVAGVGNSGMFRVGVLGGLSRRTVDEERCVESCEGLPDRSELVSRCWEGQTRGLTGNEKYEIWQ